jgi:DNA-binding HxlR family transcriptional regulator
LWYDFSMNDTKRSYHDSCGLAQALDLVGERWALLVVRELVFGPKRFTDLRAGLPGISPNVLTQRLTELEQIGVVHKRRLPPPVAASVYDLTDWGRELDESLMVLGRWAARSPSFDTSNPLSADSVMMSIRTMFQPTAAHDLSVTLNAILGDNLFVVDINRGSITVKRGSADDADATIETDAKTLAQILYEGRDPADGATITGDADAIDRFRSAFSLPEPATVA